MWATGDGFGLYYKRHLVPFGEYLPFSSLVGPILDIFGMPMESFSPGDEAQPILRVGKWSAAPFICYEIAYPKQVRKSALGSDFLVTISNDSWFGSSIEPQQHLQIAQFRSKETGLYLIHATNTGISAIIDGKGKITSKAAQFRNTSLSSKIKTFSGVTPFVKWGYGAVIFFLVLLLLLDYISSKLLLRKCQLISGGSTKS